MRGRDRRLLVTVGVCVCSTWAHAAPQQPDFGAEPASGDARCAASRVVEAADNAGLPFVIMDKKEARDRRPQRMASANPGEHRISFGCIVVPVDFFEHVIDPTLGSRRGVVYVLPEASPVQAMFGTLEARLEID